MNVERALAIGVVIAAGVAVVAGLLVLGSPAEERSRRMDAHRVEDLQNLTWALRRYHEREGRLPERIEDVVPDSRSVGLRDPRTDESYTYRALDDETFELCASFELPAGRGGDMAPAPCNRFGTPYDEPFRFHDAGPQCFILAAVSQPALRPGF